jgi:hypothetical protein
MVLPREDRPANRDQLPLEGAQEIQQRLGVRDNATPRAAARRPSLQIHVPFLVRRHWFWRGRREVMRLLLAGR